VRGAAPEPDTIVLSFAFAWLSRALLGIGLLCFLSMLIEGGMADWSGVYLPTVAGTATATAAAGYAAFSMMMPAGRVEDDWTVRRLGDARVFGKVSSLRFDLSKTQNTDLNFFPLTRVSVLIKRVLAANFDWRRVGR
jgi:hypothetical protein